MAGTGMEFIDNRGPNTMLAAIKALCRDAVDVDVVVAFASARGVDLMLPSLSRVARTGHVRVIVGLMGGVTEPQALVRLREAGLRTKGAIEPLVARDEGLHRKLYLFHGRLKITVVAGSSNLTSKGLTDSGEWNTLVRFGVRTRALRRLCASIPELVSASATRPLTQDLISRYRALRGRGVGRGVSASSIARLLNVRPKPRPNFDSPVIENPRWFRAFVSAYFSRRTELVLADETGWDRTGWSYMSVPAGRFRRGDRVVLFDTTGKLLTAKIIEITDVVRTARNTRDGRWFAAYRLVRGFGGRTVSMKFLGALAEAGLFLRKGDLKETRQLRPSQVEAVLSQFRKSKRH